MNNGWFGTAVMVASCWICAGGFLAFGLFAKHYKKPVWFWSGSTVDPNSIADIPAYNRANSRMWMAFSLPFWISGLLGFWLPMVSGILLMVSCIAGTPVLIIIYNKILKKYKINDYE